jgi:hypothetical protein
MSLKNFAGLKTDTPTITDPVADGLVDGSTCHVNMHNKRGRSSVTDNCKTEVKFLISLFRAWQAVVARSTKRMIVFI